MAVSKRTSSSAVDCEQCTHFTGSNGYVQIQLGCTKGHEAESEASLIRHHGCSDFDEAPRSVVIFRRFKHGAEFQGNGALKPRQAAARRTATSLAKAMEEFGDLMDPRQLEACRSAVAALDVLAKDLSKASALAVEHKKARDAAREHERHRNADALADRLLAGWSEAKIVECAEHLAAMDMPPARRWLERRRGRPVYNPQKVQAPSDVARRLKTAPPSARAELIAELRGQVADVLNELDNVISRDYTTRADFDVFSQLLRDSKAAKASIASLVADAVKRSATDPSP